MELFLDLLKKILGFALEPIKKAVDAVANVGKNIGGGVVSGLGSIGSTVTSGLSKLKFW
jgi:hypothetical protein